MIFLNVDLSAVLSLRNNLEPKVREAFREAARDLAAQSHAHLVEEAQANLHSSREKYIKGLSLKQVDRDTWVVTLDKSAMFIEEGMMEHEMIDDLLKSKKAKTAKDGSRYVMVPFQHNKGPTSQTPAAKDLTDTIRAELKRRQIPYGKLEMNANGQPKTGLLHSFDIMRMPIKAHVGPGQGHGQIGDVRQGMTGIPFLQNIRIYQQNIKDPHTGKMSVKRSVMTFRMASSKHKGTGRWVHPGLEARKFFDQTADWALQTWASKIVPDIMKKLDQGL